MVWVRRNTCSILYHQLCTSVKTRLAFHIEFDFDFDFVTGRFPASSVALLVFLLIAVLLPLCYIITHKCKPEEWNGLITSLPPISI